MGPFLVKGMYELEPGPKAGGGGVNGLLENTGRPPGINACTVAIDGIGWNDT